MATSAVIRIAKEGNKFLKGDIFQLGNQFKPVKSYPTNIATLDQALGIGGLPEGRIIELWGPESSGKTTLMLSAMAAAQQRNKDAIVTFVDAEHALDPIWARRIGVDMNRVLLSQPSHGEEGFDVVKFTLNQPEIALIIVDSVPALMPKALIDSTMEASDIGLHAKLMSKGLRSIQPLMGMHSPATVVFINQLRQKIGMGPGGSGEYAPGGLALRFYASVRMEIKRVYLGEEKSKGKVRPDAILSRVMVKKNKIAPPFRTAEFYIHSGSPICSGSPKVYGPDRYTALLEVGVDLGVIDLKGSNYYFEGERLGNGFTATVKAVIPDQPLYQRIADAVQSAMAQERETLAKDEDHLATELVDKAVEDEDGDEPTEEAVLAEAAEADEE